MGKWYWMDVSLYRFNLAPLNLKLSLSLRSGQRSLKSLEPLKWKKNLYQNLLPHPPFFCMLNAAWRENTALSEKQGRHHASLPSLDLLRQLPQLTLMANNIILCFSLYSLNSNSSMNPYYTPPFPLPPVLLSQLLCLHSSPFSPLQTCSVNGLNGLLIQPVNLLIP